MVTYQWYYHLISAARAGDEHGYPYKLAGPLCDGGDVYFDIEGTGRLPEHRKLPEDVELGETSRNAQLRRVHYVSSIAV